MISLPPPPKVIEKKDNEARFSIEGLYPNYGVTFGNSLRRILLSSLPGAAITQVKIKNVAHEFSTIPWVSEDVISILLNLKQLRFKIYGEEPQKATLKVKGEKEVKGSDIELPTQLELVNRDVHIATITNKKAELEMEILVEKGFSYVPQEARKKEKLAIGTIAIDAIFTPVRKVSYSVENMRVGERTDFNKLLIDVETDGTITPEQAFSQASEILVEHFSLFMSAFKEKEEPKKIETTKKKPTEKKKKKERVIEKGLDKAKIEKLNLSSRTTNALQKNSVKTVAGLLRKKENQLLGLEGIGESGVKEIKRALEKLNLEFKK